MTRNPDATQSKLEQPEKKKPRYDYGAWIVANEPSLLALAAQREIIASYNYHPLISIIIPVWNTPVKILEKTISSVLAQTYERWELCIVDGASDVAIRQFLLAFSQKDQRIKVKFLDENRGIAMNSNEAIALAQGEFVAFLDHDDSLAPFALFEIVEALQLKKNVDVFYSDEDKIDEDDQRFTPFFKPGFNLDYLRSVNYMPHFLVVRKSLGDRIAWFRQGYDGAQDYDLILRLIEQHCVIAHIPKILYHWRVWGASTAGGADAKPYANTSGKKALQEHLERSGISAQVDDGYLSTLYRVHYTILQQTPLISIIMRVPDAPSALNRCLDSIFEKTTYPNFEIILFAQEFAKQKTGRLSPVNNFGPKVRQVEWSGAHNHASMDNWAVLQANGEVLLFLDANTQVIHQDWLEQMLQFALRPDVGAVGAKIHLPDGSIEQGGVILGIDGVAGYVYPKFPREHSGYFFQLVLPRNATAVDSTCLMLRREIFEEIAGFDENYSSILGDVDLCLRVLQKGYLNVWTPYSELYHYVPSILSSKLTGELCDDEIVYFREKWNHLLQNGNSYGNPNIVWEGGCFLIDPNLH